MNWAQTKRRYNSNHFSLFMQFPGVSCRSCDIPTSQRADWKASKIKLIFTLLQMSNPVKSDIGSTDVNIAIAFALFNNLTRATHPCSKLAFPVGLRKQYYLAINFDMFVPIRLNIYCRHQKHLRAMHIKSIEALSGNNSKIGIFFQCVFFPRDCAKTKLRNRCMWFALINLFPVDSWQ